jgi:hypothetical protein
MSTTTTSPTPTHERPEHDRDRTDPRVERTVQATEQIVDAAVDVGRSWAAYGLRIGKLALQTHAHTMGRVADALGALQHAIDDRADAREGGAERRTEQRTEPRTAGATPTETTEAARSDAA